MWDFPQDFDRDIQDMSQEIQCLTKEAGRRNTQHMPASHKGRVERASLEQEREKESQRVEAKGTPMPETPGAGDKPVRIPELPSRVQKHVM